MTANKRNMSKSSVSIHQLLKTSPGLARAYLACLEHEYMVGLGKSFRYSVRSLARDEGMGATTAHEALRTLLAYGIITRSVRVVSDRGFKERVAWYHIRQHIPTI